jgi:hypothetical protein
MGLTPSHFRAAILDTRISCGRRIILRSRYWRSRHSDFCPQLFIHFPLYVGRPNRFERASRIRLLDGESALHIDHDDLVLKSEGDVEAKLLVPLITSELYLSVPARNFFSKEYLGPTDIDKGAKVAGGYYPDFSIWIHGFPVVMVEAKAPCASRQNRHHVAENRSYPRFREQALDKRSVSAAEQTQMHESGPKLIDGMTFVITGFELAIGFVEGCRWMVEKGKHREVDLGVAIVASRVNECGDLAISR